MATYQTFLPDCDCGRGNGILFRDNVPCCRWCLKPWGHGGMINYHDESFKKEIKEEPKDWEVLQFIWKGYVSGIYPYNFILEKDGMYHSSMKTSKSFYDLSKNAYAEIFSVRRISDNEIFTVGDKITRGEKFGVETISKFEVDGSILYVHFNESLTFSEFSFISKLIPSNKPETKDVFTWDGHLTDFIRGIMSTMENGRQPREGWNIKLYEVLEEIERMKQSKKPPITNTDSKERITVRIIPREQWGGGKWMGYYVIETRPITEDKLSLIKQAIESVLNNEHRGYVGEFCKDGLLDISSDGYPFSKVKIDGNNYYSKEQLDKAISDAWDAARESNYDLSTHNTKYGVKYKTLSDYLQSLKK